MHTFQPLSIIVSVSDSYARMNSSCTLLLLSAHIISSSHAAVIPHAAQRDSTTGAAVQSHTLSIEALLTLIGVCVAVLGFALTLVLSWPSLKLRRGLSTHISLPLSSRVDRYSSAHNNEVDLQMLIEHSGLCHSPHRRPRKFYCPCSPVRTLDLRLERRRDSATATRAVVLHRATTRTDATYTHYVKAHVSCERLNIQSAPTGTIVVPKSS